MQDVSKVKHPQAAIYALVLIFSMGYAHGQVLGASDSEVHSFEVASVRVAPAQIDGTSVVGANFTADGFVASYVTFRQLLQVAYGIPPNGRVVGPPWIVEDRYMINAKASKPEAPAVLRSMLQELLRDRFSLKAVRGQQIGPAYALVVDGQGLRVKTTSQGQDAIRITRTGLEAQHASMGTLATILSGTLVRLDRPVIDMTGVEGLFEFELRYATNGFAADLNPIDAPASAPVIFTAIRDLGLRLEAKDLPIETLAVETALRIPTEN